MQLKTVTRIAPLMLGMALFGCGGDDKPKITDPGGTLSCSQYGTSNINISGAVTGTLNKCTAYFVATDASGPGIVLSFHSTSLLESRFDMLLTRDSGRPATGTYDVGTDTPLFTAIVTDSLGGGRLFGSTGGTVTITSSSSGTLAGNLNITAEEMFASGTPATITVSGSFTAKCIGAGSSGGTTYSC